MRRTLFGNPYTVAFATAAGAVAVLASWKLPASPWLVHASSLASGIGWILIVALFGLLAASFLGKLSGPRGAQWRIRHAALHIRVFWTLARAIAFLLGAVVVLGIALVLGHTGATKPIALSLLLLLELVWYLWGIHQIAETLRIEGHSLRERQW